MAVKKLSELIAAVNRRVDDVVAQSDAIEWFDAAKDRMGIVVGCKFPDLDPTNTTTFPYPFNDKYWELLVLYAATCFKEKDVMLDEARNFMRQFEERLKYFETDYEKNKDVQYRDDDHTQQFVASAGQLAYVITKPDYDPKSGNLRVFINAAESWDWQKPKIAYTNPSMIQTTSTYTNNPRGFYFNPTTLINQFDKVTALWEVHDDLMQPPHAWWGRW